MSLREIYLTSVIDEFDKLYLKSLCGFGTEVDHSPHVQEAVGSIAAGCLTTISHNFVTEKAQPWLNLHDIYITQS